MRFTVLTATYNRAHTIEGVYRSLCSQTFRDFEWVIVDDGSSDGTRELVSSWDSFFPIRYIWKPNAGKHTAVNLGVAQAQGEFIAVLDSDDCIVPHALERFDYHWRQIPNPENFATLVCLCTRDGAVHGPSFPDDFGDVFTLRDALALAKAERWGVVRTDVFRRFPYPVFRNERNIQAGVVWNRILKRYATRYFNEALRIYAYTPGSLCNTGRDLRYSNPKGAVIYNVELALSNVAAGMRLKAVLNALRFSAFAGVRDLRLAISRMALPPDFVIQSASERIE
jgi:glycosyltransferase involved in cell wall biosynthesis